MPPVRDNSNNRILPNNARAADVAEKGIREIIPVQQGRYMAAFRPQGIQGILYNRLGQGRPCSCQSSQKALNTRLGEDGKASQGTINELITGMSFKVTPYRSSSGFASDEITDHDITSPNAPMNKHQGQFDIRSQELDRENVNVASGYGDNGPSNDIDINELVGNFDASVMGYSDVNCGCCFGTGYVGGYAPFHAQRKCLSVVELTLNESVIDTLAKPFSADVKTFQFAMVFPRGALGVDTFRVVNNKTIVPSNFKVDGLAIKSPVDLLKMCDGLPHMVTVECLTESTITHVETQFNLTKESAYFEFPKLTKSSNLSKLNSTDPFTIILSPNIPSVREEDVIVESMFGYHLVVENTSPWNSRDRNTLGWECTVRVAQPQEWYTLLPTRGRVMTKNETTNSSKDNVTGPRRT